MTKLKYTFNMPLSDIDKATPLLAKRATNLKADMHKVLTSLLVVWVKDGDARKITGRMTAIVNTEKYYGQAIVDWAGAYAGFEWDTETKSFVYTNTTIAPEQVQQAKAEPFYEFSPAKAPTPFVLGDKLETLLKTAVKRAKKTDPVEGDNIPTDLLDAMNEAFEAWKVS